MLRTLLLRRSKVAYLPAGATKGSISL